MAYIRNFFIGAFLAVIGGMLFLRNITVSDQTNGGLLGSLMGSLFGGNTSPQQTTGILLVVIFAMLLIFALAPNMLTATGLILSILMFVFSIIASLKISFAQMSGLELTVILTMFIGGLGLAGRSAIMMMKPTSAEMK